MKYMLTLTEADHIAAELFYASTNPLKVKQRRKSWIIIFMITVATGMLGYLTGNDILLYYGLFLGTLWLFFGNRYIRWRHEKHHVQQVKNWLQQPSEESHESVAIEINRHTIHVENSSFWGDIKIKQIRKAHETGQYFFLKIATGHTVMIPKNIPELNQEIMEMIEVHDLRYIVNLKWKW